MSNEITRNCKKHGNLIGSEIIRKGKLKSGNQAYRCRKCMQELHKNNYNKNKNELYEKIKKYKQENKDLVRKWKRDFFVKNREKYLPSKRLRDRERHKKGVKDLTDDYLKHLISKRSSIKYSDIPKSLIELKRCLLMTKRKISEVSKSNKMDHKK